MLHPGDPNVAMPLLFVVAGFVVQDNAPPVGFVPIPSVTLTPDTTLLNASFAVTTGCVGNATPVVIVPPGWVVKMSWLAGPALIAALAVTAVVSELVASEYPFV